MSEEIHNLLGKYFSGQVTEQERTTVEEWAESSEENASDFKLLQKIWTGYENETEIQFDTAKAWQRVNGTIKAAEPRQAKVISFSKVAIGIAASFIVVVGLWWLVQSGSSKMETLVADGKVQTVTLGDGTVVSLRNGSLEYPRKFKGDKRNVILTGEAFFEVTKDPAKPFVINAADAEVKVLGTSFSVNTENNQVELIVKTGKVSFTSLKDTTKKVFVTAGEKALLSNSNISKELNTDPNFDAWQSNKMNFLNVPLKNVVQTIGEVYGVSFTIKNEDAKQIADVGLTVDFKDQSLETVIKELEIITAYHVNKLDDNHYEIGIR